MKNVAGGAVTLSIFGESHGPAVGAVLGGLAPGIPIDAAAIARDMDNRRAAGDISTGRREADEVELVSGVCGGHTTGAPLCLVIHSREANSGDYEDAARLPRPGHADFPAHAKYFGFADMRGGGHFSGRLTAPLVAAGAIYRCILASRGIAVGTHIARCAGVSDSPLPEDGEELAAALHSLGQKRFAVLSEAAGGDMRAAILAAKATGDSVGGVLETAVCGLPAGIGEPFFGSAESVLSALLFSVPAVKGVEFGLGFGFADTPGSRAGDEMYWHGGEVKAYTNHNGGVTGGITNGMPMIIRCAVKPTPSIAQERRTVDLRTGENAVLAVRGRHDPCVVHRARAAVDAAVAFGLVDLFCQRFGTLWQNPRLPAAGAP